MDRTTRPGRALAIAAGLTFTIGGLTILLDKDLLNVWHWTSAHWLTILTVFGTIAAGHLLVDAWRSGHWLATLGFVVLFFAGTGLVVYSSVGRQVETAGTTMLTVEDINSKIAAKAGDLKSARARRDYANVQADREMTGSRCGRRCKDWRTNSADISVVIGQLEADIAALGPQRPVNAQAAAVADIAALFGADNKARTIAILSLLVPFLKTLFFEIGAIVSLGFAFRPRPVEKTFSERKAEALANVDLPSPSMFSGEQPDPTPPRGRKTKKRLPENVVDIASRKHPVERALEINGGAVSSNHELAELLSVSDGEASKSWREIEDRLIVTRSGKHVQLALRA